MDVASTQRQQRGYDRLKFLWSYGAHSRGNSTVGRSSGLRFYRRLDTFIPSDGTRTVPVDRFYLGYRKFDLQPDEIITRVRIGIVRDTLKLYKVSRRKDLDISAFTAAIRLSMTGDRIGRVAIAYGGIAPTVIRLPRTEAFLAGKSATLDTFEQAGRIARDDIKPISDVRGSADYRLQLAENIMAKFWDDTFIGAV